MGEKVQVVAEGIRKMIPPYLHRREYGDLRVGSDEQSPFSKYLGRAYWKLDYETIFGSGSGISASFLPNENLFRYLRHPDHKETKTEDPQIVLNYFRQRLEFIQPQRREHLIANAKLKKARGVSLEKAIANMVEFAQETQRFGPTKEELKLYEQFCHQVYSTK
ncbi:MAG: hypothetical protein KAQ83_02660 [Nanoarchaeota archaeon]|nr:hypothetical protein [Nanoarchaeota archaeon]